GQPALDSVEVIDLSTSHRRQLAHESPDEFGPPSDEGVGDPPIETVGGLFGIDFGPPFTQILDKPVKAAALAALGRLGEEVVEHLEGHLSIHQLRVIQCPEKDMELAFVVGGLKLLPSNTASFQSRVR